MANPESFGLEILHVQLAPVPFHFDEPGLLFDVVHDDVCLKNNRNVRYRNGDYVKTGLDDAIR